MDFGKVEYIVRSGSKELKLRLTLVGQGDGEVLRKMGLAGLRRQRILRLTDEAQKQGSPLGYEDLSSLLLSSLATLKRDVFRLESGGVEVQIRGRRKNGNGKKGADV